MELSHDRLWYANQPTAKREAGMPRLRITAVLFLTALAWSSARAEILDVPGSYPTIWLANANASHGDTVRIAPGRYSEIIFCSKRITFLGMPGTVWDGFIGSTHENQLTAVSDSVQVAGIEFQNGAIPIQITGDDARIENCIFRGTDEGIYIDGARAEIVGNSFTGIQASNSLAIEVDGPLAVIKKNNVTACYSFGISVDSEGGGTATLFKNRLTSNQGTGSITVANADGPVIKKNRIVASNVSGICIGITGSDDAVVSGNMLRNLHHEVTFGIRVGGHRATISGNTLKNLNRVAGSLDGIRVIGSDAVIEENAIRGCGGGPASETHGIGVFGSNALLRNNLVEDLGGSDGTAYGLRVIGDDANFERNTVCGLFALTSYGAHCVGDATIAFKNRISDVQAGGGLHVTGNDFSLTRNRVADCGHDCVGIAVLGNPSAGGSALLDRNTVSAVGHSGIHCTSSGAQLLGNAVSWTTVAGIRITGHGNVLQDNDVQHVGNDAYLIDGNNNLLTDCAARYAARDGFDLNGTTNQLEGCSAMECAAEGLDNGGGSGTRATWCTLRNCRIDYAGNNTMVDDTGTTYTTGGPGQPPEID
ncbi:MAG: right-handed parallel beta-helix repeat-containing protein [Planctomycetota bacterium]